MKKKQTKVNNKFTRFILIGVFNTILGTTMIFGLYNIAGLGYWLATGFSYVVVSLLSCMLNKKFTFHYKGDSGRSFVRFCCNIAVCYVLAYGMAKPAVRFCLQDACTVIQDNVSILVGMGVFTILNYLGQNFFAFKE